MATKLNAVMQRRVKALGVNAKTEEEAREQLLVILADNDIDGMEQEDLETLIEIAESFADEISVNSEEEENDELADEIEEEEEEEEESEEEDETEEEEEEEEEEVKPAKKSSKKEEAKPVKEEAKKTAKKEVEKPVKEEAKKTAKEEAKKTVKKEVEKTSKRGTKIDPKNNESDRDYFEPLKKLFPESEYLYSWVASSGVTIKHKGKNSQRSIILVENCSIQNDNSIKCNLYLLTFTKTTEILDKAGIDYEICWSGAPFIKGITLDEAVEIVSNLMDEIVGTVQKIDKKLGENRKKMEENLSKKPVKKEEVSTKTSAVKKTIKKK